MEKNNIVRFNDFLKESGYPTGAENDPNAPYNRKDPEIVGKSKDGPRSGIHFKVIDNDQEYVLLTDKRNNKDLYATYIADIDNMNNLDSYRPYTEETEGEIEYADNIEAEGIENWAWNEVSKDDIGIGLEDWENPDKLIVKLDDELAQELYTELSKSISPEWRSKSKHFKTNVSRETRLLYTDMLEEIKETFPEVTSEWIS